MTRTGDHADHSPIDVTIAICTFNGELRIGPVVSAALCQDHQGLSYEVLVIDNASTDGTAALVDRIARGTVRLRRIRERRQGLQYARECAARNARGRIISFVDDDNIIPPNWVQEVTRLMQHPGIDVIGCSTFLISDEPPPDWFWKIQHAYAVGSLHARSGPLPVGTYVWGAGLTVSRNALLGLYDSQFLSLLTGRSGHLTSSGDDGELCLALQLRGHRIWFENDHLKLGHRIDKARLSWGYARSLHRGFGAASVELDGYFTAVEGRRERPPLLFLRAFVTASFVVLVRLPILLLAAVQKDEGHTSLLELDRGAARLGRLWKLRREYGKIPEIIKSTGSAPCASDDCGN